MSDDIAALLRETRDNEREAPHLQRGQVTLYVGQLDRAERINGRAEAMQASAGRLMKPVLYVAVPALGLLMSWLYLRYFTLVPTHR